MLQRLPVVRDRGAVTVATETKGGAVEDNDESPERLTKRAKATLIIFTAAAIAVLANILAGFAWHAGGLAAYISVTAKSGVQVVHAVGVVGQGAHGTIQEFEVGIIDHSVKNAAHCEKTVRQPLWSRSELESQEEHIAASLFERSPGGHLLSTAGKELAKSMAVFLHQLLHQQIPTKLQILETEVYAVDGLDCAHCLNPQKGSSTDDHLCWNASRVELRE
ncbi:hypothetical protein CYMTET_6706 [Cymbomonas tetramitiformis]|uniref:Uncharacterized protein n=1 Tax=Cymbomonas tetramitiformis TaxID=36881 RepID=A0AAE0GWJ5_9CHLO|nr:hypothetical protein CYMTET_6706 [Cymbomonas tetramitiformis]